MMISFWKNWKGSLLTAVGIANERQDVLFESEAEGQEIPFGSDAGKNGSKEAKGFTEVQSSGFKMAQALYKEILAI